MGNDDSVSSAIKDTIRKATALNDKTRLKIVLAIFNTEILKIGHSLTLSQLERILVVDKHALAYHLKILKEVGIITKEEIKEDDRTKTYYQTTKEGIELLYKLGISRHKIEKFSKEIGIFS